jgi:hypothetical protein
MGLRESVEVRAWLISKCDWMFECRTLLYIAILAEIRALLVILEAAEAMWRTS